MTQGDASLAASTHRNGSVPFRRNWAVDESRAETTRDDRTSWQERMGLTVEEALELPGLAGTTVAAGASGLGRVVRHMVVDDPADPLAAAGPDVLVVLGARLPPADPANCRALVERLDSMGTAALAFRRTEGPAPVPGEVLAEAERRGLPVLALPPGVRHGRGRVGGPRHRRHQAGPGARAVLPHGRRVHGGGAHRRRARPGVPAAGRDARGHRRPGARPRPRGRHQRRPGDDVDRDQRLAVAARRRRRRRPRRAHAVAAALRRPRRPDRRHARRRPRRRRPVPGRRHPARPRPPRTARRGGGVRRRADHGRATSGTAGSWRCTATAR